MKNDPRLLSIDDYDYDLPSEKIAATPLAVRHESKLLCYKNKAISDHRYIDLPELLPSNSFLVFNETKVIPARLLFEKNTGGLIEIFCLQPDASYREMSEALLAKGRVIMQCLVGGASKWKPGVWLIKDCGLIQLQALVKKKEDDHFLIEFQWTPKELTFAGVLETAGATPLPPYIKRPAADEDRQLYQTVYAKQEGSVAAPTAGLHFTEHLLSKLNDKKIEQGFLTLHVGAGTFKPVKAAIMQGHNMHAEWIDVSLSFLEKWQAQLDKPLVTVGTTTLRTLESLYWLGVKLCKEKYETAPTLSQWECYTLEQEAIPLQVALASLIDWMRCRHLENFVSQTALLVVPGYRCKVVNGLLTNFHQPRSTLLLLIASLVGDDWRKIYRHALENQYRFLSFGDGSLLWRNDQ
ncbi:MAG: S-adenosylmethionine:tRNA ribosyltransferase-isomerase [Chitinophagia bacterium]|nr:S-adenosylmethionine:tRNA ribosyltransferase-isomerase [Chitinophagia bacterium]